MNDILALPAGPLAEASLSAVTATESKLVADHSIRSFLYARLLADQEGSRHDAAYDENLLFAACVLHDLGLGTLASGNARFEVEGADLAASLLGRARSHDRQAATRASPIDEFDEDVGQTH